MKSKFYSKVLCVLTGLLLAVLPGFAQNRTVSGTVTGPDGQPLIGAGVFVKGDTRTGTVTDEQGSYSLSVPSGATLVISYIGYLDQEAVPGSGRLDIVLQEDNHFLDEVVVIGYGTVKKRDLTGAVAHVKSEDVVAIPTTNALESLQGKIAGLDMIKSSGQAGAGVSYSIRGNRSLNASNAPLILVDGVPYGSDIDINPESIQSIEVLKDASSTAIYGSRGANGVIIITTKKGAPGRTRVSYSGYYSVDSMWDYPDLMDTQQYAAYFREAKRTSGKWTGPEDDAKVFGSNYEFVQNNVNVDWVSLVSRPGYTTSHSVSLSHGGEKTQFNAAVQYLGQQGIIYNDDFRRINGTMNLSHKITDRLTFDGSFIFATSTQNKGHDPFNAAVKYGPWGYPYNEDGSVNIYPYNDGQTFNPLNETIPGYYVDETKKYRTFAGAGLTWTPVDGLVLRTNFNANIVNSRQGMYDGSLTQNMLGDLDRATVDHNYDDSLIWENTASYNFQVGRHDIGLMAGAEIQRNVYEFYSESGRNLLSQKMGFYNLESLQSQQELESQYTKTTMASFFGRMNYKYADRYLLTATLRYDGASQLAEGHQWGLFPSVAAGWVISEEPFLKGKASWLDNLKLRASWGVSGNSAVSAYQTAGGLGTTMYVFDVNGSEVGQYGYWPQSIPNHDLGWEKTASTDIGLDLSVLKNRIDLSVDWYLQNTSDLLMRKQIPVTNGYLSTWANVGKTRNTGVEVVLNTKNIVNRNFQWSTDLTFTHNKEEIVELADGQQRDIANGWFVGSPIDVHYGLKKLGIWQISEEAQAAQFGYKPGQVKNEDISGANGQPDGKIDIEDRIIIGTPRPQFTVGFNNHFRLYDFGLSVFMIWRHGAMMYMNNFWAIGANMRAYSYIDYWTPENPTNEFPRPDDTFAGSHISLSGLNYYDASFLKIRDITLEYFLPSRISERIGISDVRLYCTAKNFFQFNNLPTKGYDAERMGGYGFPTIKQLIFGLNLNF